ncbi:MAG: hypothetical protein P8M30_11575 [Planctomycetaceae bacterium]|nr:hypothetical protein [Planctomycetaceae bacterium]MDC0308174.1 hypothetical protein [Planctomycetaceae bacterium]MDG2389949.1 hypothetical protein [Planctomycetaceae bacterium]
MRHIYLIAIITISCLLAGCGGDSENYGENRNAALLVLTKGGYVRVQDVGILIKKQGQLPQENLLVTEVNLSEKKFNDLDLVSLKPLGELEVLNLYGTQVTDEGMSSIAKIKGLKSLELSYTAITDEGLEKLSALSNLSQLYLHGTQVSKEAIDTLKNKLKGCKISH